MSAVWQLDANSARLTGAEWTAALDLARPDRGLLLLFDEATQLQQPALGDPQLQILGVMLGDQRPQMTEHADVYVRGNDVVATYDEAPPQCLRAQIYWRYLPPEEFSPQFPSNVLAGFDFILSLNTSLLDNNPQSHVSSSLSPGCTLLQLQRIGSGGLNARAIAPVEAAVGKDPHSVSFTSGNNNTGCFIARWELTPNRATRYSYVEMVHPADFNRSVVTTSSMQSAASAPSTTTSQTGGSSIKHHLFQQRLEKGVILRARIRAAVVKRSADEPMAITAYERFAAAEPPLTV
jgi:hypothetical protein